MEEIKIPEPEPEYKEETEYGDVRLLGKSIMEDETDNKMEKAFPIEENHSNSQIEIC